MKKFIDALVVAVIGTITILVIIGVGELMNAWFGLIGDIIYITFVALLGFALLISNVMDWWDNIRRRIK